MRSWLESFLANRPLLYRIIGRIVRPDDIEDVVQETFLHAFAASRKQKVNNPRAFMVKIARNLALNHIGRAEQRLNMSMEDAASLDPEFEKASLSLESQHQSQDKFLIFCRAVSDMPTSCRRVFILKKVYGLSQKEISEYLNISQSTVEKHVAKGLLLASNYMASHDYSPEVHSLRQKKAN